MPYAVLVPLLPTSDKTNRTADTQCEWDPVKNTDCRNSCTRNAAIKGMATADATARCNDDSMCLWQNGVCFKDCKIQFDDPKSCNAVSDRCMWTRGCRRAR